MFQYVKERESRARLQSLATEGTQEYKAEKIVFWLC